MKLDILTRFHKLLRNQNTGRKVIIKVCLAVSTMALGRKTQLKVKKILSFNSLTNLSIKTLELN
jgi:hypothetical protein